MPESIDELYRRIVSISEEILKLPQHGPDRLRLETERDELRTVAAEIASTGRHPMSVEREIESLERRLADIEAMQITRGYQERRGGKNLQDPGAYSSTINRLLDEHHVLEVTALNERIASLKKGSPASRDEGTD